MNFIRDLELYEKSYYNMIVEIPKGTKKKFELNPETFDKVECVRKIKYRYPFYYGCFPKTLAGDNDPTDAILITNKRYKSLDIVKCYPVAVIKTVDWGFIDDKVILLDSAAKLNDRKVSKEIRKIMLFLSIYKGKDQHNTTIDPYIYGASEAKRLIEIDHKRYKEQNTIKLG